MAYLPTFVKAAGLVSPASQQRTGSSTASSTHPDLDPQLDRGSVSPTNRTESWLRASSLKKDARTYDIHKVRGGKVAKAGGPARRKKRESFWGLPLLFGIFGKGQDDKGSERGLDGDTLIRDGDVSTMAGTDNDSTLVGDDDEDEVRLEKTERTLKDYSDRYLDYNDPRIKEWTSDEIWLFNKLAKRGAEPLLDAAWIMDYPTFPDQLFTNDRSQVYINNMHGPIYNGMQSPLAVVVSRPCLLTYGPYSLPLPNQAHLGWLSCARPGPHF